MTVYFTSSVTSKKQNLESYRKLIEILKEKNIRVIEDRLIKTEKDDLRMRKKGDLAGFKKKLEGWINSCDFMIAGVSFPSVSVGYEISLALHRHKPVLVLYSDEKPPPTILAHSSEEKLVCEKYTNDTLKKIIENFISYVKGQSDQRFTFFITSEISSYLKKVSKREKVPKSVYLRRLIENDLKRKSSHIS